MKALKSGILAFFLVIGIAACGEKDMSETINETESGLKYRILTKADGDGKKPTAADTVTVHYTGTLTDGTVFDSSVERGEPISFGLSQVIAGWTEGVQLMEVGDKFEFTIPSELGYGEAGAGDVIPANATLIFEIELLSFESEEEKQAKAALEAAKALETEKAFLEANAGKDDITVTESGLQYRVLQASEGDSPTTNDMVTMHYKASLMDGTVVIDSRTRGEPAMVAVGEVERDVAGWGEGLKMMASNSVYEFTIPSGLAFGAMGAGPIPPHSPMIFEVELISFKPEAEMIAEYTAAQTDYLSENAAKEDVTVTDSGLQYSVIDAGKGATPGLNDRVTVHYTGKLVNGSVFDSSVERGQPATFGVTQVIAGWTEALQQMKVGDKWELTIPSELGYGEQGSGRNIPPGATLIFEVELLAIEKAETAE